MGSFFLFLSMTKHLKHISFLILFFSLSLFYCSNDDGYQYQEPYINNSDDDDEVYSTQDYKILSLGDSYTIGQSVCSSCRFPVQLKDSLSNNLNSSFYLDIIAQTGWTTTNLISVINSNDPTTDYDLVTLLIGVNNQYQGKLFSIYEEEFPQLVNTAIESWRKR